MKHFTLFPYESFSCIADRCRHSCCKGWEIDVDEDALAKWPEEYLAHVAPDADTPRFVLLEGDVCPFLTEKGLCRMILEHGEDILCEICREHPRWHNFLSDREETGLGLCCEEAARLTLTNTEKANMRLVEDDGEEELEEDLSAREEAVARLQNRALPFAERLICAFDAKEALSFLLTLERMDEAWTSLLTAALANSIPDTPHATAETENAFEQFAVALTYRHGTENGGLFLAEFSTRVFMKLCALWEHTRAGLSMDAMVEICRLYSCEIEYSDENTSAIVERFS